MKPSKHAKTPRDAVNLTRRPRIQGGLIPGTRVTKYYTPQETKSSESMIHHKYILGPLSTKYCYAFGLGL